MSGEPCDDPRLRARVGLQSRAEGLWIDAFAAEPRPERVPDAPPGARVADLWHYDVVECFLAGEGGRYLEVEIGPGGHFLVLSFDAPRRCCDEHLDLVPDVVREPGDAGWGAGLRLPWAIVPDPLRALNAFACARGQLLAHHPLPGDPPDFHQPARFPAASLERP